MENEYLLNLYENYYYESLGRDRKFNPCSHLEKFIIGARDLPMEEQPLITTNLNADNCLLVNLKQQIQLLEKKYKEKLQENGIELTEFLLLGALYYKKDVTAYYLINSCGFNKMTMKRYISSLKEHKLIQAKNETYKQLHNITDEGKNKYCKMFEILKDVDKMVCKN